MNQANSVRTLLSVAVAGLCGSAAMGQSNIDETNKFAWGENIGWLNFRDAGSPAGNQGANVGPRFLSGFVWSENCGWINLGDGTPSNGVSYANPTGGSVVGVPDFGVNRDPVSGNLSGFAWGENIGWINFGGGALATPAQPARVDAAARRLRGYAWGENVGWINLDVSTAGQFVAIDVQCGPADIGGEGAAEGGDGILDNNDFVVFIQYFFSQDARADLGSEGGAPGSDSVFDNNDFIVFIQFFFEGC
jgi:hypothetical protein